MNGATYNGKKDETRSGLKCQAWADQFPHARNFSVSLYDGKLKAFLSEDTKICLPSIVSDDDFLLAGNFCRNPLGERSAPWCFTQDPNVRWEYCDIPLCPGTNFCAYQNC